MNGPIGIVQFLFRNMAMIFMSQYAADGDRHHGNDLHVTILTEYSGLMGMSNMFVLSTHAFEILLPEYCAERRFNAGPNQA